MNNKKLAIQKKKDELSMFNVMLDIIKRNPSKHSNYDEEGLRKEIDKLTKIIKNLEKQ